MSSAHPALNISHWSILHPIGILICTLTVIVSGIFCLSQIKVDLLPHIIYPDINIRVNQAGVPANIMEDKVTRQLEEQLAITEGATHVESTTRKGSSSISLSFKYGENINIALRDASARLDRAKRFLPTDIEPPIIYKRDPSRSPIAQFIISSDQIPLVQLKDWADYRFSKWLINLPDVAAVEVGGGFNRQIRIIVEPQKLANIGLTMNDLKQQIEANNQQLSAGRLRLSETELTIFTSGKINNLNRLKQLPIILQNQTIIKLSDIATIIDSHEDERLKIRFNQITGVQVSIQKQPDANTIVLVKNINQRIAELKQQGLIPKGIHVDLVDEQARYIQHALNNTLLAAAGGTILAMLLVFLFLGDLKRTFIIGCSIPIALLATFIPMLGMGLTFNMMTLGGLALGVGMLVDNTIVMLENIYRHQQQNSKTMNAVNEVRAPIIASTTTNLAAILPFLFVSGLIGLLFRELIFTITFSIIASALVALTLVPSLAHQLKPQPASKFRKKIDASMENIQYIYGKSLSYILKYGWLLIIIFILGLIIFVPKLLDNRQIFLPKFDEGLVYLRLSTDNTINVNKMDQATKQIEQQLKQFNEIEHVFTTVGGFVFGRSQYQASNRASIRIKLKSLNKRGNISTKRWIKKVKKQLKPAEGFKLSMYSRGLRGIRTNRGDDDLVLRIQGDNFKQLGKIAQQLQQQLEKINGLSHIENSQDDKLYELAIKIKPSQAARFNLTSQQIGEAVRYAVEGVTVTQMIKQDRAIDIRLQFNQSNFKNPQDLKHLLLRTEQHLIRLEQVASFEMVEVDNDILRDNQQRIVEVSASLDEKITLVEIMAKLSPLIKEMNLPEGYYIYETGGLTTLRDNQQLTRYLIAFALFLVFAVMAIQYESLRNPLIILMGIPFTLIGVQWGLAIVDLPLSMPIWLGIIMLIGIVVNNAIVLIEQIEICRQTINHKTKAIIEAAKLRLRPILMTSLTTIIGMLPLAFSLNEGGEMLQPLAVTIVSGLLFSLLVSLGLMPVFYYYLGRK